MPRRVARRGALEKPQYIDFDGESVAESLKPDASGTSSHEATAQRLGSATHALRDQANRLRGDVDRFVLG